MRFDHIDLRVRDVRASRGFYDALLRALGVTRRSNSTRTTEWFHAEHDEPFFGIHTHRAHVANKSRIAFAAESRAEVDRVAAAVRRAGARNMQGPDVCKGYRQPYYAVFFEDADGNKFEICCRRKR